MRTRVTTKGRITIPRSVRAAAGIDAGTELNWRYDPATGKLFATPVGVEGTHREEPCGSARGAMTTDEMR